MRRIFVGLLAAAAACGATGAASALNLSVPAVGGDVSRGLLGDGTGVVVGVVDSGVDDTHPALQGSDSLGRPRLVAEANFVGSEPASTGDDVFGHGTWVASVIASSDRTFTGLAPDARYVNARVLDSGNGFPNDVQVRDGVGFALDQGADVLNLSLNYFSVLSAGNRQFDLMLDWAASERGVLSTISAGNIGQAQNRDQRVRGPGGAFNVLTVGRTDLDFDQVHPDSAVAFTQDGRLKPDLVAPGTSIRMANDDWETQADFNTASGTSFAAPHVAGLIAQQLDAGRSNGLSTNPLVVRATLMNSASKAVRDKNGDPWAAPLPSQPLDTQSGAGQVDGVGLAAQYLAGEQGPGRVDAVGWDLASVQDDEFIDYVIDTPLAGGSLLTATLTWFRNVDRTDRGQTGVDSDDFFSAEPLDNLDLQLLKDGAVVAESNSLIDNVEHLHLTVSGRSVYTLRVAGIDVVGSAADELFAVAWASVAVPEPAAAALVAVGALLALTPRRAARRRAA